MSTPADVFVHEARQMKAEKLAEQIVACFEDAEVVTGATFTPDDMLAMGLRFTLANWEKLARDAQVRMPSEATRVLAIRLAASTVRFRADRAEHPSNGWAS